MRNHPVTFFLLLAFGTSWGIFAVGKWVLGISSGLGWTITSALFMLGPALAAVVHRRWNGQSWPELGVVRSGIRWKWMGIAVAIAMALPPFTLFFNWLLGDVMRLGPFGHTAISKAMVLSTVEAQLAVSDAAPGQTETALEQLSALPLNGFAILLIALVAGALAGCTVNFVFAMGEELGWRGTLYHFTWRWGLWKHVGFTGLVWGLWHAPLILEGHNYPDHPVIGVGFMCLLTTALALPLAWVRYRSGCVWSAGVLHGTVNGVAGISVLFTQGTSSLAGGATGLSAVLGLIVISALLFILDPQFRRQFSQP
jgi:membrane protease YdiL (CAAX protease family)